MSDALDPAASANGAASALATNALATNAFAVNGFAANLFATGPFDEMNKRSLDLIFNAQKAVLDELILINNTVFEHTCGEIGVASEMMSKLAEAHSVKAVMDVYEDCRKHQVEVLRRDNDFLVQSGKRLLDRTAGFLTNSNPEKAADVG